MDFKVHYLLSQGPIVKFISTVSGRSVNDVIQCAEAIYDDLLRDQRVRTEATIVDLGLDGYFSLISVLVYERLT